jgi:hypothetical protein
MPVRSKNGRSSCKTEKKDGTFVAAVRRTGSLLTGLRPQMRRKGRKTSCARARRSSAYISTVPRSILSTGTSSPAARNGHTTIISSLLSVATESRRRDSEWSREKAGDSLHGVGTKARGGMTWTSTTRPAAGDRLAAAHCAARRLPRPSPRTATAT